MSIIIPVTIVCVTFEVCWWALLQSSNSTPKMVKFRVFSQASDQRNESNPNPKHVRPESALTSGGKNLSCCIPTIAADESDLKPPPPHPSPIHHFRWCCEWVHVHATSRQRRVRLVSFRLVSYQSASSQHAANRNEEKWKWARSSLNWSSTASQSSQRVSTAGPKGVPHSRQWTSSSNSKNVRDTNGKGFVASKLV